MKFLEIELDQKLELKTYSKRMQSEARRRNRVLAGIAGTVSKPRAPSHICHEIFGSMIKPLFFYCPSATVCRSKSVFNEQDKILRIGARIAHHCPPSILNEYIEEVAKLQPSRATTLNLARRYLDSADRSPSVKLLVQAHKNKCRRKRWKRFALLDTIFPQIYA